MLCVWLTVIATSLLLSCDLSFTRVRNWKPFVSTEGRFKATFPEEPNVSHTLIEWDGQQIPVDQLETHLWQGRFQVRYSDYPESAFEGGTNFDYIYDYQRDEAAKLTEGVVIDDRDLTVSGHPGREFAIKLKTGQIDKYRFFMVGNRVYQLNVSLHSAFTSDSTAIANGNRFLDSFEFVP